jgi:hypothetical protein
MMPRFPYAALGLMTIISVTAAFLELALCVICYVTLCRVEGRMYELNHRNILVVSCSHFVGAVFRR